VKNQKLNKVEFQTKRVQGLGVTSVIIFREWHQRLRGSLFLRHTANQTDIHGKPGPKLTKKSLISEAQVKVTDFQLRWRIYRPADWPKTPFSKDYTDKIVCLVRAKRLKGFEVIPQRRLDRWQFRNKLSNQI